MVSIGLTFQIARAALQSVFQLRRFIHEILTLELGPVDFKFHCLPHMSSVDVATSPYIYTGKVLVICYQPRFRPASANKPAGATALFPAVLVFQSRITSPH